MLLRLWSMLSDNTPACGCGDGMNVAVVRPKLLPMVKFLVTRKKIIFNFSKFFWWIVIRVGWSFEIHIDIYN